MKRALVLLGSFGLLGAACRDFGAARDDCVDAGRCTSASGGGSAAGGGGVSSGGGGGGSSGGGGGGSTGGGTGGGVATGGGGSATGGGGASTGGGSATGGGGSSTGGGTGTGCSGVFVFAQRHYATDTTVLPPSLEPGPIEADSFDGGGFSAIPAASFDGGFCMANTPPGPLYLKLGGSTWIYTSATSIDLSRWFLGRADVIAAGPSSALKYSSNAGLNPGWSITDDRFRLFSYGATLGSRPYTFDGGNQTALPSSFVLSLASTYAYSPTLVESSEGDVVYLGRYTDVGIPQVLTQYLPGTANAGANNTASVTAGNFVDVPLNESIALNWQAPAISGNYASDVYAFGTSSSNNDIELAPDLGDAGLGGVTLGPLVEIDDNVFNGTIDYGNPFGGNELLVGEIQFTIPFKLSDGGSLSNPARVHAYLDMQRVPDGGPITIGVDLSPPHVLTFNGSPLQTAGGTAVTTPLTIGWSQPLAGSPDSYQVVALALSGGSGGFVANAVATVIVPDRNALSITLPPLPGGSYVFLVSAFQQTGYDPLVPLKSHQLLDSADAVSGIVELP